MAAILYFSKVKNDLIAKSNEALLTSDYSCIKHKQYISLKNPEFIKKV